MKNFIKNMVLVAAVLGFAAESAAAAATRRVTGIVPGIVPGIFRGAAPLATDLTPAFRRVTTTAAHQPRIRPQSNFLYFQPTRDVARSVAREVPGENSQLTALRNGFERTGSFGQEFAARFSPGLRNTFARSSRTVLPWLFRTTAASLAGAGVAAAGADHVDLVAVPPVPDGAEEDARDDADEALANESTALAAASQIMADDVFVAGEPEALDAAALDARPAFPAGTIAKHIADLDDTLENIHTLPEIVTAVRTAFNHSVKHCKNTYNYLDRNVLARAYAVVVHNALNRVAGEREAELPKMSTQEELKALGDRVVEALPKDMQIPDIANHLKAAFDLNNPASGIVAAHLAKLTLDESNQFLITGFAASELAGIQNNRSVRGFYNSVAGKIDQEAVD
jgi:hypothetical protein